MSELKKGPLTLLKSSGREDERRRTTGAKYLRFCELEVYNTYIVMPGDPAGERATGVPIGTGPYYIFTKIEPEMIGGIMVNTKYEYSGQKVHHPDHLRVIRVI